MPKSPGLSVRLKRMRLRENDAPRLTIRTHCLTLPQAPALGARAQSTMKEFQIYRWVCLCSFPVSRIPRLLTSCLNYAARKDRAADCIYTFLINRVRSADRGRSESND